MKLGKNLAYMSIGATAVLAYQKYNKPLKKHVDKFIDKTMKKTDYKLEDMM